MSTKVKTTAEARRTLFAALCSWRPKWRDGGKYDNAQKPARRAGVVSCHPPTLPALGELGDAKPCRQKVVKGCCAATHIRRRRTLCRLTAFALLAYKKLTQHTRRNASRACSKNQVFFLHSLCMSLNAFLSLCILLVSAFNCLLLPIAVHCQVCQCLPQIVALWRRTDATLLYENRVKVKVIEPRAKPSSFGCDIATLTKMILLE